MERSIGPSPSSQRAARHPQAFEALADEDGAALQADAELGIQCAQRSSSQPQQGHGMRVVEHRDDELGGLFRGGVDRLGAVCNGSAKTGRPCANRRVARKLAAPFRGSRVHFEHPELDIFDREGGPQYRGDASADSVQIGSAGEDVADIELEREAPRGALPSDGRTEQTGNGLGERAMGTHVADGLLCVKGEYALHHPFVDDRTGKPVPGERKGRLEHGKLAI
jgi:hypothetical protein